MDFISTGQHLIEAGRRADMRLSIQERECTDSTIRREAAIQALEIRIKEVDKEIARAKAINRNDAMFQDRLKRLEEIRANITATLSRCR